MHSCVIIGGVISWSYVSADCIMQSALRHYTVTLGTFLDAVKSTYNLTKTLKLFENQYHANVEYLLVLLETLLMSLPAFGPDIRSFRQRRRRALKMLVEIVSSPTCTIDSCESTLPWTLLSSSRPALLEAALTQVT